MVLSQEGSDNHSGSIFERSDDYYVMKFFFMLEKVTTRRNSVEDMPMGVICHLHGEAFDFYQKVFSREGSLTEEVKMHRTMKKSLIERFGNDHEPKYAIRIRTILTIDNAYFMKQLLYMYNVLNKSGFNDAAMFYSLR